MHDDAFVARITDPTTMGPFYTTAEVARLLRIHQRTIQQWIHIGLLPARRYGRVWRIRQADLVTFGEEGPHRRS
jgi:excisionase family DNA binding protein